MLKKIKRSNKRSVWESENQQELVQLEVNSVDSEDEAEEDIVSNVEAIPNISFFGELLTNTLGALMLIPVP